MLAPTPIQTPHTAHAAPHKKACLMRERCNDTSFSSLECNCNLLTHDTSLHKGQDITQEPPHVSTSNSPLKSTARSFRRRFSYVHPPAPATNVKIHNRAIRICQDHAPRRIAAISHCALTLETSSRPSQFPDRRLLESARSFVSETDFQALRFMFFVAYSVNGFSTNTACPPITWTNVDILWDAHMPIHTACLVARRQSHILVPAPIQTTHTSHGGSYEAARFARLWHSNAQLINSENKSDLLAHNAPFGEWQNITQEPPHVSTRHKPHKTRTCTCRRRLSFSCPSTPTTNVEIDNLMIRIGHLDQRLRKTPLASSNDRHSAFTIEASGCPAQLPQRRLLERALSFVRKARFQTLRVTLLVARDASCFAAEPTGSCAVARSDVEVLRRPSMAVHAVRLVTRCHPHI